MTGVVFIPRSVTSTVADRIYESFPNLYECFHTDYDFDREVAFMLEQADEAGIAQPERALEVGCGTGQHTIRLATACESIVGLDMYRGMLELTASKGIERLVQGAIPDLPISGEFELVVAVRAVINHLPPDLVKRGIRAMADRLATPGVLIFDNFHFPPEGVDVALEVGEIDAGSVARIVTMNRRSEGRLNWDSVFFLPDGEPLINRRPVTIVDDATVEVTLRDAGLDVTRVDGFHDGDDDRTVFVGVRTG